MFVVLSVKKNLTVSISLGSMQELPLAWADGMVGVMPVFETMAQAEYYADEYTDIVEIKEKK